MKKILLLTALLTGWMTAADAQTASQMSWSQICSGKMSDNWYGSDEARKIADAVVYVQKNNGGWTKNVEHHKLTTAEQETLRSQRAGQSCLDNGATTMEMRFLAKVYQKTGDEKYQASFLKAVNMLLKCEKGCGGWSQYWPLSGNGSYQDYITFNDDLTTNVMRLLSDIIADKGDMAGIVDAGVRQQCQAGLDRAIEAVIRCQVDDNGTPAAWCAQHDTATFLPTEGRPHELPSISGYESAALLSYLMTIEHPSAELQQTIHTAIAWLDAHKIADKAVEDYVNADGASDRRVVDKAGSAIWGRFIQLGGESAERTYQAFFNKLKTRGKSRSYTTGGKTYTYTEYEIATASYDPSKAYQPIYAIYDNSLAHLFYRFLYSFEDAEPIVDSKGCPVATSLNAKRRTSYQYLGSWPLGTINTEYPAWKQRLAQQEQQVGYVTYTLSSATYTGSPATTTYAFDGGFTITNEKAKAYATGLSTVSAIKYSAGVAYTIHLPEGVSVDKVDFYGYDNYADADAWVSQVGGRSFASTDYVFPRKDASGNATIVSHTIDCSDAPLQGSFTFTVSGKQCGLAITLYQRDSASGITSVAAPAAPAAGKAMVGGRLIIGRDGRTYDAMGRPLGR